MNEVTRYITRQLFWSTAIVSLVMTGLLWLFVSVKAVESIINRGLSLKLFIILTSLQLPNFLVQVVPIAFFIAVLFVYSRLNSDSEITVLRAAGMSPLALAKPVIMLGLFFTLLGYTLTLWATPTSYQKFRELQWDIRYSISRVLLKEGVFNSISDKITVYIRERSGESELAGLLVHDSRDKKISATVIAERGAMVQTPAGARVLMFDGSRQEIDRNTGKLSILYFDRYSFDLGGATDKPKLRFREARERGVQELLKLKRSDVGNPKDYGKFITEAHQRLAIPVNAFGFALIAYLFVMLGGFSRRGQLAKITGASAVFVSLQVLDLSLVNLTAKNLNLIPAIYGAYLAPAIVGFLLLLFPNPPKLFGRRAKQALPAAP
ncbi:MAG: LPS export ABC transporter permease LptF [Pseudomonadota bacterium]|nr:LPS export ABC transporter permease LptF [Pseudomonadota bacterium]